MNHFFNNLKIKYKLLIIYSSVFIAILFTSSYIIYNNVKKQIEYQINEELSRNLNSITRTIDTILKSNSKNELKTIAIKSRNIMMQLYHLNLEGKISKEKALIDLEKTFLKQKIGETGYIVVTHNNKKNKKYSIVIHPHLPKNKDLTNIEIVQKIMSIKEGYSEYSWKNENEKFYRKKIMYTTYFEPWDYAITVTAYFNEMSKIINISELEEDIRLYKIGASGFINIIGSDSKIIYSHLMDNGNNSIKMNSELSYIYNKIKNKNSGKIYYNWNDKSVKTDENNKKIALFKFIPKLDWYLVTSVYLEEFNSPLRKLESTFITSFILLTILIVIVTFWISSYITQPLYNIIDKLKQAKQNEFKEKIEITSSDELGELVTHYNSFMEQLEMYSSKLALTAYKFHAILDNTTAVIYIKDIDGKYELVNKQYEKIFNIKEKDILEKKDNDIFSETLAKQYRDNDIKVLEKGASISLEENININNEIHSYISIKFPLFDKNNKIVSVCGISTDITNIKRAEERILSLNKNLEYEVTKRTSELLFSNVELESSLKNLEKTQEQLIHSEKMASLGDLVAGVAHEINTPVGLSVTGISHLEILNEELRALYDDNNLSEEEFREYLDSNKEISASIHVNLNRAAELIRSFKQVAVDQSCEISRIFNVKEYIDETIMSLKYEIKKTNHKFIINCSKSINIKSQPGPFSQIITNLIMNSMIHGFKNIDSGQIIIDIKVHDKIMFLTYKDNGVGIKKENLSKIYNPFYTTNRSHGGTGLGLNIIYNIVTSTLNGKINCYSDEGQGVKFIVEIPLYEDL